MQFDLISSCITFLYPLIKQHYVDTLNQEKPANGYLCLRDTVINVTSSIMEKSIEVLVTHVPSGSTAIYPSFT